MNQGGTTVKKHISSVEAVLELINICQFEDGFLFCIKGINMEKEFRKIKIAQIGLQEIELPVISLIANKVGPRVLIISGVHGCELSGVFILNKLLEKLEIQAGELHIIPVSNPMAFSLKQRENPTDNKDLNRVFPGNPNGNLSERIAAEIFKFAREMDLVIDLHTFEDPCPIVGIFMNTGTEDVKNKSLKFIKAFAPELVWKITFNSHESDLAGALGPKLSLVNVANFAVETPEHFRITETQLNKVVDGLINVLKTTENISQTPDKNEPLKIFKRQYVKAQKSGMFIANKELFENVKEGDILGELISLDKFEKEKVISQFNGQILISKKRDVVATGDDLMSIGQLEA